MLMETQLYNSVFNNTSMHHNIDLMVGEGAVYLKFGKTMHLVSESFPNHLFEYTICIQIDLSKTRDQLCFFFPSNKIIK